MDSMMMDAMSKDMMSMAGMDTMDMSRDAGVYGCLLGLRAGMHGVLDADDGSARPACMNCADMCNTMMRAMMRMQGMNPAAMMAMLDACIAMCQLCMDECMEHADTSEVCKMCAQACQACMDACMAMKDSMMAMA